MKARQQGWHQTSLHYSAMYLLALILAADYQIWGQLEEKRPKDKTHAPRLKYQHWSGILFNQLSVKPWLYWRPRNTHPRIPQRAAVAETILCCLWIIPTFHRFKQISKGCLHSCVTWGSPHPGSARCVQAWSSFLGCASTVVLPYHCVMNNKK